MPQVIVNINFSKNEIMSYYTGAVKTVTAQSTDGQWIKFPANILRQFVDHNGVSGTFLINFNSEGKYESIARI